MVKAARALLLLSLVVGVDACGIGGSSSSGPPVPGVMRLLAPTWVEVGEPFTVQVTASYPRGIEAVEIAFEGETRRLDVDGRPWVRVSQRLVPRLARMLPVEVVVVGVDGVRGPAYRFDLAVAASDAVAGEEHPEEFLRYLDEAPYGDEYGGAAGVGDTPQPGPTYGWAGELIAQIGPLVQFLLDPWWTRWRETGGPQHWNWTSACGSNVTQVGPTGAVLSCWLEQHPQVAERIVWEQIDHETGEVTPLAYPQWSFSRQLDLAVAFWEAYTWLDHGLGFFLGGEPVDPPVNQISLVDCAYVHTGLTDQAAWDLYVGTVAHSLALEIGGFVPWSVTGYTAADLETLFHSKYMFDAKHLSTSTADCPGSAIDFTGYLVDGPVIPAPATTTFEWLVDEDILRWDHWQTVARLMTWARSHMLHISGSPAARNMEAHYQYRGDGPASRIMTGTTYVDPDNPAYQNGPHSWSPSGCHGVAHFFRAVMRCANLPVRYQYICGHGVPVFWTIGRTMTHGDDIYNSWSKVTPSYPANELLVTTQYFSYIFLTTEGDCGNVGRRPYDLLVTKVPNELVDLYCDDLANNLGHAQGQVYDVLDKWYSVQSLESQGLWTTLADKVTQQGGCGP